MANPIKAFLGKSYTKNGITKTYLYNPATEKYGWYNTSNFATDYGRNMFKDYDEIAYRTYNGDTKASILRTNIKTVITKSSNRNIEGMDELMDEIYDRIDAMSDYEIDQFAEYNKKSINLYFEYEDVVDTGVDARIINLADALGIDIYDYIEKDDIPDKVKFTLQNINDYINLEQEFKDVDKEILDKSLGRTK